MPDFDTARFLAPTPGMSLTKEPGNRPWERPPKYPDAEDALEYYIDSLSSPAMINNMFDILERGFPVTVLVDTMVLTGVMQGLHTIDVGVLLSPALYQFIVGIADMQNIEFKTGLTSDKEDTTVINDAIREVEENPEGESDELIEMAEQGIKEAYNKGLMSKPDNMEQGEE